MSVDFSHKERAFIAGLLADTGRDLDGWMSAIAASGHTHRNDIIDWLRQNGFTFARASWLERIHHNGGRLIYAVSEPSSTSASKAPFVPPKRAIRPTAPAVAASNPVSAGAPSHLNPADSDIDALLAAAKAYRPLAQLLLRDILATVPGADAKGCAGHIVLSHSKPFAALIPGPKDVKLQLAFGATPPPAGWTRLKPVPGLEVLSGLSHTATFTDARQINAELRACVVASARETAR